MKTGYKFILLLSLFGIYSCGGDSADTTGKRVVAVEEEQSTVGRRLQGGDIRADLTVRSTFRDPSQDCLGGFGICKLEIFENEYNQSKLDSLAPTNTDDFDALMSVVNTRDFITLEFLQPIHHFQEDFHVRSDLSFPGLFNYEYVVLKEGTYPADSTIGLYGGVRIAIEKGKELIMEGKQ